MPLAAVYVATNAPDFTFIAKCCIVHAPDSTSGAACGTVHVPDVALVMGRNVHAPDVTYRGRGCSVDVPDSASGTQRPDAASMLMCRDPSCC